MAKTIQGFISAKTGLVPAFKEIADLPEGQDGILRIETADLEGELALSKSRYITGAYVQTSGAKGVDALKVLLSARKGSFRYAHAEDGFAPELQQRIRLDIHKLVAESEEAESGGASKSDSGAASTTSSSEIQPLPEKDEPTKSKERASSSRGNAGGPRIYADNFDDEDDDYDSVSSFGRSGMAPIGESLFSTEDPADADDDEWLKRLAKPKAKEKEEKEAAEREAKLKAEKDVAEKEAQAKAEREAAEREAQARAEREAAEREAQVKAEREAAEREAQAKAEREAAEREAQAKAEREAAEREAQAKAEREAAEREAQEKAEREARAKAEKEAAEKEAKAKAAKEAAEKEAAAAKAKIEAAEAAAAQAKAEREATEKRVAEEAAAKKAKQEAAETEARELAEREAQEKAEKEKAEQEAKAIEKEAAEREARLAAAKEKEAAEKQKSEEAAKQKENESNQDKLRAEKFKEAAEADPAFDQRETAFLKNLKALPVKPVQSQLSARRSESKVRPKTEADYEFGKVDMSQLPSPRSSSTNLEASKTAEGESLTKPTTPKKEEKKTQWSVPSHFENVHAAGTHTGSASETSKGREDFSDIDPEIERELAIAYGGGDKPASDDSESDSDTGSDRAPDEKPVNDKADDEKSSSGDKTSDTLTPVASISQNKMSALGQLRAEATKAAEAKAAVPSQLKRPLPLDKDKNKDQDKTKTGIDISELDAIKTPNTSKNAGDIAAKSGSDDTAGDDNESWVAKVVSSAKQEKVRASQMKMTAMAPVPEAPKKDPTSPSVRGKIGEGSSKQKKEKTKFLASKNNRIGVAVLAVGVVAAAAVVGRTFLADSYAQKAATLMAQKDYKQALAEVNTALSIDNSLKVGHFNKGQIEAKLDDNDAALVEFNSILKDDPNHTGALEHRAEIYIKQGQYREALADCNKLTQLYGDKPTLTLMSNKASANMMLGNNIDALSNFTMALQQSPNKDPQLLIGRGIVYGNLKQFDKANKDLEKALKLNPKNPAAYVARAKVYLAQKNFDAAFADFNRALVIAPGDAAVLTQRGASLGEAGQFDQAANSFSQAIKANKNYAEAYKQRAHVFVLQHKYPEALADVAQFGKIAGTDADYYRQRGDIYTLQGADAKAIESYSASIAKTPTLSSLQSRAALYAKKNDLKAALTDIASALSLNANDSDLYVQKATYEEKNGDTMSAKNDFTKAINLYPLNVKAHVAMGQFLLKQQEASAAEESFDAALKIDPKSAEASKGKGAARVLFAHLHPKSAPPPLEISSSDKVDPQDQKLIASGSAAELISAGYKQMSRGNNERAIALLAKAVRLNPNDANARRYIAHALMANGDTDNAIAMLKAIVAINPDSSADNIALGEQLVKTGRVEDAIDTFSKTLSSDKHNVKARCALARAYMSAGFKQKAKDVCDDGIKDSTNPAETAALKATLAEIDNGGGGTPAPTNEQPGTKETHNQ